MSRDVTISPSDTVIHVNRGVIDGNRKHERDQPPLSARRGRRGKAAYSDRILILGADGEPVGEVVYNKAGILPCGAKAVIIAYHGARVMASEGPAQSWLQERLDAAAQQTLTLPVGRRELLRHSSAFEPRR